MKKKIKMNYLSLVCYFLAITSLINGHSLVNSHKTELQQQNDIDQTIMDELDEFNNVLEYVYYNCLLLF